MLQPEGRVARLLPGFELRPGQLQMLEAVSQALDQELVLFVEAGTGVGKSLAYGIPAAHFVRQTQKRVVISSATINLQEQLVKKDLPLLNQAFGQGLAVELVKGRNNYLCRRRLEEGRRQRLSLEDLRHQQQFELIASWAEKSSEGSFSELDFRPAPELVEQLCSDADACLGRRCSFHRMCFFHTARRRAEKANLLVVNHHLLCAHLALKSDRERRSRGVLPPFEHLIIDEAHELEDSASSFFGLRLTHLGCQRFFGRLSGRRSGGLLAALAEEIRRDTAALGDARAERLRQASVEIGQLAEKARGQFRTAFERLKLLLAGKKRERLRLIPESLSEPTWAEVGSLFQQAADLSRELARRLQDVCCKLALTAPEDSVALETLSWCQRAQELAGKVDIFFAPRPDEYVRWAEAAGRNKILLEAAPLEVAGLLHQALYRTMKAVVHTSATLSVGGDFSFLTTRLGANLEPAERLRTLVVPSPFDFRRQALLVVPQDLPAPEKPGHEQLLEMAISRLAALSGGGTLVLFTSRALMNRLFERLRVQLEEMGLPALCQGSAPRSRLLGEFRRSGQAVLFGVDSFWQGVDVVGPALRQVIITRLPFDVPTEPLIQARGEQIAATGASAFEKYFLPRAVLKLKQGFGRLIRSRSDFGVVALLDNRVLSRTYGKRFLGSLPPASRQLAPFEEICRELAGFFHQHGQPGVRYLEPL